MSQPLGDRQLLTQEPAPCRIRKGQVQDEGRGACRGRVSLLHEDLEKSDNRQPIMNVQLEMIDGCLLRPFTITMLYEAR